MHWAILPYRRYFDFSGRSRRMELWFHYLFYYIVTIILFAPFLSELFSLAFEIGQRGANVPIDDGPFDTFGPLSWAGLIVWLIFALVSFIPGLAVTVRRFHDVGMSGWVYVALYIANIFFGIVFLVIFVICFLPSNEGANKWGRNPKDPFDDADVFE